MLRRSLAALAAAAGLAALPAPAQESAPLSDKAAARYLEILERNPGESALLDRLWKWHEARGTTQALVDRFAKPATSAQALLLGQLQRKASRPEEARAAFRLAADLEPASAAPWQALAELASGEEAAGFLEQALQRLSANDLGRAALLVRLGQARLEAGNAAAAGVAWENAAALNPADSALQFSIARSLDRAGERERARAVLERVAAKAPPAERLEALRQLAASALTADDFPAAQSALHRALELAGPSHWLRPELQQSLIRLHQRSGREEELVAAWTAAAEAAPRDLPRLTRLADLFAELGDGLREAHWLEKALALVPRERELRSRLARLLAARGDWDKAAYQYDELLRAAPRPPLEAVLARAELDVQLNHPAEAVARVQALLDAPGRDDATTAAVLAFFQRNRFDAETEKMLRAARNRSPQEEAPTLALAEFLANQRRSPAARAELDRWTAPRPGEAPAARAARLERAADFLRGRAQSEPAAKLLAESIELDPQSPSARRLALVECLLQLGDTSAARRVAQEAYSAARTPTERAEADERLYQAMLAPSAAAAPPSAGPGRTFVPARDVAELREFLAGLAAAAKRPGASADDVLRLARMQARAGVPEEGIETALRLVRQQPKMLAARELIVRLASETGRQHVVIEHLQALAELDPERASQHRRALAQARLDRREFDEAISILEARVKVEPGSAEALIDLAAALQRAERWYDACAQWERAYAAASQRQRADLRPQFIAALEKVGNRIRAAELLAAAHEAATEPARQQEIFRELTAYCANAGILEWLATRTEARVKAAPADYAALSALAEVRKAQRRDDDAWELLRRARFSTPQPAAALQSLVETAEERGDLGSALEQQRRLTLLPGEASAANLERLAALEESALDLDAAALTWEKLAARFPRDPALLGRAAEYFRRLHDSPRERRMLRAVARLDAAESSRLLRLAALDRQSGDAAAARETLEQLLAATEPPAPGTALVLPVDVPEGQGALRLPGRGRGLPASTAVPEPKPAAELLARLEALRELGQLVAAQKSPAAEAAWIERWRQSPSPSEKLAAWFHAGRADLVLDWLEPQAVGPANSPLVRGFVAVALHGRLFARLGRWLHEPADADALALRRTVGLEGIEAFLRGEGGRPAPEGLIEGLFPGGQASRTRLWGDALARVFVAQHRYREAVLLSAPVLASLQTHRATLGVEMARWFLQLGERDNALSVLRFATEGRNPAETLEAVWFEALRMQHHLLPPAERPEFAARMQRVADAGGPAQSTLAAAWLAALAGDENAARPALERWLALRPALARETEPGGAEISGLARHFHGVLASGQRLEALGRPALALHLWQRALAGIPPGSDDDDRLREVTREVRQRSHVLAWTLATPGEAEILVSDYLARRPPPDEVANLATALQSRQDLSLALRLRRWLHAAEPGNADYWRSLQTALRTSGDWFGVRETLQRGLTRVTPAPAGIGRRELILQLVEVEEKLGNQRDAREHLLSFLAVAPRDTFMRQRLAQNYDRAGLTEESAATWRAVLERESDHPIAAISLSYLEERRGNRSEALRLLEALQKRGAAFSPDAAARLLKLQLEGGGAGVAKARELARSQLRSGQYQLLARSAELLAEHGEGDFARELLTLATQRCREPNQRFQLAQALLDRHSQGEQQVSRALRRLRLIAETEPRLLHSFHSARAAFFTQRDDAPGLLAALRAEWEQGDVLAGQRLIPALVMADRKDEARTVLYAYLARPDAITASPEAGGQPLANVSTQLVTAGAPELAVEILTRLGRRFPHNAALAVSRAQAQFKAGAQAAGLATLNELEWRWIINPPVLRQVAAAHLERGQRADAIRVLQLLVRSDPRMESPADQQQLASLLAAEGDFNGARKAMQQAYRSGQARSLTPLLDLLELLPGGPLEASVTQIAGDYHLRPELRRDLSSALAVRLFKLGRGKAARAALAQRPLALAESTDALAPLREAAANEAEFVETDRIFREALLQAPGERQRLAREASLFALRWARRDWSEGRPEKAFEHLKQATAWLPQEWSVAEQAFQWRSERNEKAQARAVLQEFLTHPLVATADRAEALRALNGN